MKQRLHDEFQLVLAALMFYTRLPVPNPVDYSESLLNKSRKYFPLVGILVGICAALVFVVANTIWNPSIATAISMAATILLTGAFHEDGFADSCDGLGGGWTQEQVLTIMKDSRVGTYAVVGLILIVLVKFLSLFSAAHTLPLLSFSLMLIAAHALSRQLSSSIIERYDYVQDIDVSKVKPITDQRLGSAGQLLSLGITAAPLIVLALFEPLAVVFAITFSVFAAAVFIRYCQKRIGGYTGDILGATQQICELVFYLAFLAAISTVS